jgi:DNA-binding MarR family transcriptional regulator
MISEELKTEMFRTMFRIKNMQNLFHRHHLHHHQHQQQQQRPDCAGPPDCDISHTSARTRNFAANALVILNVIAMRERMEKASTEESSSAREGGTAAGGFAASNTTAGGSVANSFAEELQKYLHVSKAAISQNLMALEKKGLITRAVNPHDLRRFDFALTEKGKTFADHLHQHLDHSMDEFLTRMGERDTREYIRLFNKLADIMEDLSATARPFRPSSTLQTEPQAGVRE